MSMVQEALTQAKALKERVIETIDAFRPKILIKEPLSQISPLKKLGIGTEIFEGQGIGMNMIQNLRNRIEMIREHMKLGLFKESVSSACVEEVSTEPVGAIPTITETETKKKEEEQVGIHY